MKSPGAEEVLDMLMKQSAVFVNPRRVITNRGSALTSSAFRIYYERENIQHLQITAGGDGQVEECIK